MLISVLCIACGNDDAFSNSNTTETLPTTSSEKPNILLIIADDMGLDATPGFDIGSIKPNMPNLQNMITNGIRFSNLWSNPTCTPTRSTILTGKYGFRTNVLNVGDELSTSETSLQQFLTNNSPEYSNAVIGKWHLSSSASHPTAMGVDYYAGLLTGGVQSYLNWRLTENQQTTISTEYSTSKFTDLAIDWVNNQTSPWFLWLAYNAPHTPFHLPPNELHSQGSLPSDQASIDANPLPYYFAMLEAMDTEIGRLLNSMSDEERENTLIIFIGDNGTTNQVVQDYASPRAKGTIYQGGVNVPMIVSGKNVNRSNTIEDALVNTTDLFATIADIAGTGTTEINDSKSFKELLTTSNTETREYVYTEIRGDNGTDYTIRNATHKYILFADGREALYDLSANPLENPNLLNANQLPLSATDSAMKDALVDRANEIRQ